MNKFKNVLVTYCPNLSKEYLLNEIYKVTIIVIVTSSLVLYIVKNDPFKFWLVLVGFPLALATPYYRLFTMIFRGIQRLEINQPFKKIQLKTINKEELEVEFNSIIKIIVLGKIENGYIIVLKDSDIQYRIGQTWDKKKETWKNLDSVLEELKRMAQDYDWTIQTESEY